MSDTMYFYFYPEYFPISGESLVIIYDTIKGNFVTFDKEESMQIKRCLGNKEIEQEHLTVFKQLEQGNYGFFRESKSFVEPHRIYSPYLFNKPDLLKLKVKSLLLKLNDKGNDQLSLWKGVKCPIWSCQNEPGELSLAMALGCVDKIKHVGLEEVVLTGGNLAYYGKLHILVEEILKRDLKVKIVLHENSDLLLAMNKKVGIIILSEGEVLDVDLLKSFDRTTVSCVEKKDYERYKYEMENAIAAGDIRLIHNQGEESIKGYEDLRKFNLETFCYRKDMEQCMLGRLHIDHRGDVKTCFHRQGQIIGNIQNQDPLELLAKLVKDHWFKPQRKQKCAHCELYYACPSCRYTEVESVCGYEPALGRFVHQD